MKIEFLNLGPLHKCKVELGDLTIVTGHNNTGKTYVTYGVFGLLAGWRHWVRIPSFEVFPELSSKGTATVDLQSFTGNGFRQHLTRLAHTYKENLSRVLAAEPDRFADTKVHLDLAECSQVEGLEINLQHVLPSGETITLTKLSGELFAKVGLQQSATTSGMTGVPTGFLIDRWLTDTIIDLVFQPCFPRVYIASTERTGAAIFQRELNLGRNRLIEMLADLKPGENPDPWTLMHRMASSYAFPVQQNVDFLNPANLEPLQRQQSALASEHPEIVDALEAITGGTYKVTKDGGAYFQPNNQRGLRLRLGESSSAVRSLLDVTYYVRHVLRPGDCFMIDEPELNLHPKNQRLFARLIARIVNAGVKVFLTTHSDYVIRELNTVILLSGRANTHPELLEELKYSREELIGHEHVRFYRTSEELLEVDGGKRRRRLPILEEVKVTMERGIEVESFDTEIDDLNHIQDVILYTAEDTAEVAHD